jgi:hypothetical protein
LKKKIPTSVTPVTKIEKPLISLSEGRKSFGLKTSSQRSLEKIDKLLSELKVSQSSTSRKNFTIQRKGITSDSENIECSHDSTDFDTKILEKKFGKIDLEPKLQRIFDKSKPGNLTKNWYSKPTPPDLQFEERFFQSQFSVSTDKLCEWNIDGLSKQELMNKMNHMSMVANVYDSNQNLSHSDIVDLLTIVFSRTLHNWWDKHLTEDSREKVRKAVKHDEEGFPIFDEHIGRGEPDGVNTLIYTINKHFVGIPSNITSRIFDYLNNLRCPTMSDYRWCQDVFLSCVIVRSNSQKPYRKEKFINGLLPSLFAVKVKDELINSTASFIEYDNLTYGDLFSTIKKLGIKISIDQKMIRQQLKKY